MPRRRSRNRRRANGSRSPTRSTLREAVTLPGRGSGRRSPLESWGAALQQARAPLGALEQRSALSTQFANKLPDGPDGEYAFVLFRTSFANKVDSRETVTLERGARRRLARDRLLHPLSLPRGNDVTETVALSKFACPSCGGEAIWNPAKQKLVCPFCGTESPAKLDAAGTIVEHDLVSGAARDRRRCARLAGGETAGQVPELQCDLGARSVAAGAELRILRLGAARTVHGDEAGVPSRERAAVHG